MENITGTQKKRWEHDIKEWTGLDFIRSHRAAEDSQRWGKIVADVSNIAHREAYDPGSGTRNFFLRLHRAAANFN